MLATEVTRLVHGDAGLEAAGRITQALFSGSTESLSESDVLQLRLDGLPASTLDRSGLKAGTLTQVLTDCGMAGSGKQVKDALGRQAVTINGRSLGWDDNMQPARCFLPEEALFGRYYLAKLGKKKYQLFEIA